MSYGYGTLGFAAVMKEGPGSIESLARAGDGMMLRELGSLRCWGAAE